MGLVLGVVLAAAGVAAGLATGGGTDGTPMLVTSTTTPVVVIAEPDWLGEGDEASVRFEATVVVVDSFEIDEGVARLSYDLASLGQVSFAFLPEPIPGTVPEDWRLTTTSGVTIEATTGPPRVEDLFTDQPSRPSGVARFELPESVAIENIALIEITGWRLATPVEFEFDVDTDSGSRIELFDGSSVVLARILEQRNGTIIGFDVDAPADPWRQLLAQSFGRNTQFRPTGNGWLASSSSEAGFQFTWHEATAPSTITINMTAVTWLPTTDTTPVVVYRGSGT